MKSMDRQESAQNWKGICRGWEAQGDLLWREMYSRRIRPPDGYGSPKRIAFYLSCVVQQRLLAARHNQHQPEYHGPLYLAALQWMDALEPVHFVGEELARSLAATRLPSAMGLSEIKWPSPLMVFVLPNTFTQEELGTPNYVLSISLLNAGLYPGNLMRGQPRKLALPMAKIQQDAVLVNIFDPTQQAGCNFFQVRPLTSMASGFADPDFKDALMEMNLAREARDEEVTHRGSALALKLLLASAWVPGIVSGGGMPHRAKGRPNPSSWEPKWIGKAYRIPKKSSSTESSAQPQFHLRFHLREGHWRDQPHGMGRKERKRIWIEPYFAGRPGGSPEDATATI